MIGKEYYDKEEKKMALFKRNPNEADYYGGKKHFIDVIKNNGDNTYLFWRQPEEDFNTHSKLIVMPGETAIFVEGGNIVQQFSEGTYELTTNNYPFISRLKNALSGGISTFHCVIYFFKNADSMELKWGTDDPIQVRDKVYGIRTSVQARGSYKVRIENPALFLEKFPKAAVTTSSLKEAILSTNSLNSVSGISPEVISSASTGILPIILRFSFKNINNSSFIIP